MGRLSLLIKAAALVYIISMIKSRGRSKNPSIGIGILVLYILQKVHHIGCWQYKLKNKNLRILFHKPFFGSLLKTIETAHNGFHDAFTKQEIKDVIETKHPFTIWGSVKLNAQPNYCYHIYDPRIIKYVFEDHFEDYIKGPAVHDPFEELLGINIYIFTNYI